MHDAYLSCFLLRKHSFSIPNYISFIILLPPAVCTYCLLPQIYKLNCNILVILSVFSEIQAYYDKINLFLPSRL